LCTKTFPFVASERLYNNYAFIGGAVVPQPAINSGLLHSPVHDLSSVYVRFRGFYYSFVGVLLALCSKTTVSYV